MHADSIHNALSSRLKTASQIQGRHIRSVAVKIDQDAPQTAWLTITDHTDAGGPIDHLVSLSWSDEHVARELAPHLGMGYTGKDDELR